MITQITPRSACTITWVLHGLLRCLVKFCHACLAQLSSPLSLHVTAGGAISCAQAALGQAAEQQEAARMKLERQGLDLQQAQQDLQCAQLDLQHAQRQQVCAWGLSQARPTGAGIPGKSVGAISRLRPCPRGLLPPPVG